MLSQCEEYQDNDLMLSNETLLLLDHEQKTLLICRAVSLRYYGKQSI